MDNDAHARNPLAISEIEKNDHCTNTQSQPLINLEETMVAFL